MSLGFLRFCFEYDERVFDYYADLRSSDNGKYFYDSHRWIKVKTIPIPMAILNNRNPNSNSNANANANTSANTITNLNTNAYANLRNTTGIFCGLFPEIQRAYFIRDNEIFLWDYMNNRWCCLNQFSENIRCVAIAKPKPNVFVTDVKFLLVVSLTSEINIIGLGFSNGMISGEIEAFPTQYKISTDNEYVCHIVSNERSGQIFIATLFGSVFEISYSHYKNLLGQSVRQCSKTNISDSMTKKLLQKLSFPFPTKELSLLSSGTDNTNTNTNSNGNRNGNHANNKEITLDMKLHTQFGGDCYLFILSSTNSICGYVMANTDDSSSASPKKVIDFRTCLGDAQQHLSHIFVNLSQTHTHLIGLCNVKKIESLQSDIILFALTNNGDRIFLELCISYNQLGQKQHKLRVAFIRLRPPFLKCAPQAQPSQAPAIQFGSPRNVSRFYYADGVTVFNSSKQSRTLKEALVFVARDNVKCQSFGLRRLHESIEAIESNDTHSGGGGGGGGGTGDVIHNPHLIYDLAEVPLSQYLPPTAYLLYNRRQMQNNGQPLVGLTQFAVQHLVPARLFCVLTPFALVQYKYLTVLDLFEHLLLAETEFNRANDRSRSHGHAHAHTHTHAGHQTQSPSLLSMNLHTFFQRFGIVECEGMLLNTICCPSSAVAVVQKAKNIFILFNGQVSLNNKNPFHAQSSKIFAFYLWLSRILRCIWYYSIVVTLDESNNTVRSRFAISHIEDILQPLCNGLRFMNECLTVWRNDSAHNTSNNNVNNNNNNNNNNNSNTNLSNNNSNSNNSTVDSLSNLISFTDRIIQVLEVFKLFCIPRKFHFVFNELTDARKSMLKNMEFHAFIMSDTPIIIKPIIQSLLKSFNKNMEKAQELHCRCPLLFESSDFMTFSANCEINNNMNIDRIIDLYKTAASKNIKAFDLHSVCFTLRSKQLFTAVIDLSLYIRRCCLNIEALQPKQDESQNEIFLCLSQMIDDNVQISDDILSKLLNEKAMNFLFDCYQFFLERNLLFTLYDKDPRFLEEFLCNPNDNMSDRKTKLPKLMKYYSKNKKFSQLIFLIHSLACSPGFSLNERFEFLDEALFTCRQLKNSPDFKSMKHEMNSHNRNHSHGNNLFDCDSEDYFAQRIKLCRIQIRVKARMNALNELNAVSDAKMNTLLNVGPIYELCREFEILDCALDCLSFANDNSVSETCSSVWLAFIASHIKQIFEARAQSQSQLSPSSTSPPWMHTVCVIVTKQLSEYDLNQQPWMADFCIIVRELHIRNFELCSHLSEVTNNARHIVNMLFNCDISLCEIIEVYAQILATIDRKVAIISTIEYLINCLTQQYESTSNESNAKGGITSDAMQQIIILSNECLIFIERLSADPRLRSSFEHFVQYFTNSQKSNTYVSRLSFF